MIFQIVDIDGKFFGITEPFRINKKYSVFKWNKDKEKWYYLLSFGDVRYQQYKDHTKLNLYEKLNHGDAKRRANYIKRHNPSTDPNSAGYWAHKYLW